MSRAPFLFGRCARALVLGLAATGVGQFQAQAQPMGSGTTVSADAAAMIVLDGSGSMWGKLGRDVKWTIARDAIKTLPPGLGSLELGLAAFGHRRGDCGDVEVVGPPAKIDAVRFSGFLDKFNPKGKGPIASALRSAAGAFAPDTPARRTLIVIADNADNCRVDACATARELKDADPRLTAHVIALGVVKEELPQLACIATNTGGTLFTADTGTQFNDALDAALKLAAGTAGPTGPARGMAGATAPPALTAPPKTDAPDASTTPGLRLEALLKANGEPVASGLKWRVMASPKASAKSADDQVVYDGEDAAPNLDLAPGIYTVEVRFGFASARQSVEVVTSGRSSTAVVLDAGTIRVKSGVAAEATIKDRPLYTLYRLTGPSAGPSAPRNKRALAMTSEAEPFYQVPAGSYVITVQQGLSRQERSISVTAGQSLDVDLALYLGQLQLSAVSTEGTAPLDRVFFLIGEDDPDSHAGLREVARSGANSPDFMLPAGNYTITARAGNAEARARVTVKPGTRISKTITLGSGRLTLSTKLAGKGQLDPDQVWYLVERMAGGKPAAVTGQPIRTSVFEPVLTLAAGRYRIEGRYGQINARTSREMEIKAGAAVAVSLEHEAGQVRLGFKTAGEREQKFAAVFWELLDGERRVLWTTGQTNPRLTLAAGRYIARAEHADRRGELPFALSSGEDKTIEVVIK